MVDCYNCKSEMIWGNDFEFDDCGYEGEGIVSCFSCPICDTFAEFVIPNKKSKYTNFM